MKKQIGYLVGAVGASVALLGIAPGTALAEQFTNHCEASNSCSTSLGTATGSAGDVAIDADLTNAPGSSMKVWPEVDHRPVCAFTIPESAPAGSWICHMPAGGSMQLFAETTDGAAGTIDLGTRDGDDL